MADDAINENVKPQGKPPRRSAKDRRKNLPPAKSKKPKPSPKHEGTVASMVKVRSIEWLLEPWIPRAMLTLVAGLPGVGKSTFLSWLVAQAKRACILPGYEEIPSLSLIPRLAANGADLESVRLLDSRRYSLPRNVKNIINNLKGWEADILIIDPLDSYMDDDKNENAASDVREFLEACTEIGEMTGAAIVGVRHPGKSHRNIMSGSKNWRAVPRVILELASDGGVPEKFLLKHYKNSLGGFAKPMYYTLEGEGKAPRRFVLGDEVCESIVDLAMAADGPTGRRKLTEACRLLKYMFEQEETPSVSEDVNACNRLGIGEKARDEAKRILAIFSVPSGVGSAWVMKRLDKEWPEWLVEEDDNNK